MKRREIKSTSLLLMVLLALMVTACGTGNDERQIMTSIEKCGYPQKFHGNN